VVDLVVAADLVAADLAMGRGGQSGGRGNHSGGRGSFTGGRGGGGGRGSTGSMLGRGQDNTANTKLWRYEGCFQEISPFVINSQDIMNVKKIILILIF